MNNKIYWIWLADIFGAGNRRVIKLLREFGNAYSIYKASDAEILDTGILRERDEAFLKLRRRDLSAAETVIQHCKYLQADIITPDSESYPKNLLSLVDAPLTLYALGTLPNLNSRCMISVVGSREVSEYGLEHAYELGYGLGAAGALVVSGLALGVDGVAMAAAIDAGEQTIGIIGGGIDTVYPKQHEKLYTDVIRNGAVITEYPPGVKPSKYTFPQRNRIISGISQGTVIVEAKEHSGALITARCAVFQGRALFALPGRVDLTGSAGPMRLLKDGAKAVTGAEDILEEYEFIYPHCINIDNLRRKTEHLNRKEQLYRSVKEHRVAYKLFDRKKDSFDDLPIQNPMLLSDLQNTERKAFSVQVPDDTDNDLTAPFGKFVGKGKVESSLRIDFEALGENEKKVYFSMPCDTPVMPEEIKCRGLAVSDILAALTLLEISGAVEAGAGGYYLRSGEIELPEKEEI